MPTRPPTLRSLPSAASTDPILGDVEPRLFTPSLTDLTPATSYGFAVIAFARDVLAEPLDPWEEVAVIRGGELLPDGRPRFRHVLILVARQNGKTHLLKVLALFWLFVEQWPLILGTSTVLDYAKESWEKAVETAELVDDLAALMPGNAVRRANGEQTLRTADGCRYKIAPSNRRGGRSLAIDRLIQDELREHADWSAWNAATNAMNARPFGQSYSISNMGDEDAVVLNALRKAALTFIDTGRGDRRVGLLEWSAPRDADPLDPRTWAMANPNLGRRIDVETIAGAAARAVEAGGEELAGFRVEVLCQGVDNLNPAVDPGAWSRCLDPAGLEQLRDRVVAFLDVAPDQQHATMYAAAVLDDGRVRVDFAAGWDGTDCVDQARRDLPDLLARIRPRRFGWYPGGPAAGMAPDLRKRPGFPPRGVRLVEVKSDLAAVCMGFAEQVTAVRVAHSGDPLLDDQVAAAVPLRRGDVWVFSRRGDGHVDAVYAAAGAVWLARTLPPRPRAVVLVPRTPAG